MPARDDIPALLSRAIAGDEHALGLLLLAHRPQLLSYIDHRLPPALVRLVEPGDVLQDTYFEAARRIGSFVPVGDSALYRWLVTIARHQMLQLLRAQRTQRRGQGLTRGSSVVAALQELAGHQNSPSRSAVRQELARQVQASIERLPVHYGQAVRLRHLENLPVADVARRMGRSERAVHMLCNRAIKLLREDMRSLSRFA